MPALILWNGKLDQKLPRLPWHPRLRKTIRAVGPAVWLLLFAAALGSSSSSCAPSWVFPTQDRQTESVTPAGVSLPVQSLPPSSSKLPKKKSSPGVGGSTIKVFFYFEGPGPQPNGINRVKLNSKTRIPRKSFENRDCYPKQIWSCDWSSYSFFFLSLWS